MKSTAAIQVLIFAGILIFILSLLSLHFISSEINPLVFGISYYARGKYPGLLCLGLVSIGLSALGTSLLLWQAYPSRAGRLGSALLSLWGAGAFFAGIFPLDGHGQVAFSSLVHQIAGRNVILVLPIAFCFDLLKENQDQSLLGRTWRFRWTILCLCSSVLIYFFNTSWLDCGLGGLFQRLYWMVWTGWILFHSIRAADHTRR